MIDLVWFSATVEEINVWLSEAAIPSEVDIVTNYSGKPSGIQLSPAATPLDIFWASTVQEWESWPQPPLLF